ncbi:nuclease-related domain-containing protein [Leifsonia sp. NPDC080035]|uniref:Nuclease-related domain-containing protein n=1 Tax=Leifsonia sp. NPDC080035 TaxID=3143936 RepID=A0AAU7GDZ9_9MICO
MGDVPAEAVTTAGTRTDFAGINALSSRPAGYAVALKCLEVQHAAEQQNPSLRTEERVILHGDAWPWYRGALGEIAVGALLQELGPEWFVRHSVPIGAGTKDVDHLVIGPGGVFAINTKHHAGAAVWVGDRVLRVNGANKPYLSAAHRDGADVGRRLSVKSGFPVPVTSVIALVGVSSLKDSRSPRDRSIAVVDAHSLVAWLTAQSTPLAATKRELIKLAAEEPGTWHVDPRAADTLRVMQRFERLVARVGLPESGANANTPAPRKKRRPPARRTSQPRPTRRAILLHVLRLWAVATAVLVGILILRGIANQPCTSPTGCIIPSMYAAWKPLLMLIGVAVGGSTIVGTVLGLMRAAAMAFTRR